MEKGKADLDEAIRLDPDDDFPWFTRGSVKLDEGDYAGAIEDFQGSLRAKPEYTRAQMMIGVARHLSGDTQGAIADLEKAQRMATPRFGWRKELDELLRQLKAQ